MTGKKNARIYAWVAATLFAVLSIYRVYSFYLTVKDDTFDVATDVVHLLSNLILIGLAVTLFIAKREAVAAVFSLRALCGAWTLFGSVRYFVQMLRYSFPKEYMVFPYGTTVVSDVLSLAISVLIVRLLLMPGRDGRKRSLLSRGRAPAGNRRPASTI